MKHTYSQHRFLSCTLIAATLSIFSTAAMAGNNRVPTERFTEYAKVLNVQPVYQEIRTREPRQQCWTEQERYIVGYERTTQSGNRRPNRNSAGNAIVGGLIGGVIGNQLGRSHSNRSRTGATVAGAIIGSAIGNESNHRSSRNGRYRNTEQAHSTPIYETRDVQRCNRTVESRTESQLQHYNVTYLYKGRKFVTQLPRDPGKQLELQVTVAPARR
ncbi:MAG: hypothetical protein ACI9UN_000876 [Granulosicoccus sp.]|jgi:uncharacterized protein YcfJ